MSRKEQFCTRAHGARTQFEKFSLVRLGPTVSCMSRERETETERGRETKRPRDKETKRQGGIAADGRTNPQLAPSRGLIAVEIFNQVSHVLRSFGADCICCKDWLYTHCIAEIHHLKGTLRQHADTRARTARV